MMDQLTIVSPSSRPETAMNQHIDRVRALFEPLLAHQRILGQIPKLNVAGSTPVTRSINKSIR
jgi:hypothetical protein